MLRLSRTTTGLLATAALLSAVTAWDGCADNQESSPLDLLGRLTVPPTQGDPKRQAELRADVLGRSRKLQEVNEEVVEGRLSLLAAAARVRDIQSASPFFPWEQFREYHPATTDDERFCLMVIELAAPLGLKDPQKREPVIRRLEAELEEHRKNGTLHLPER